MSRLVSTAAQIRELDRRAIEDLGVPGASLMELAARGVADLVRERAGGGSVGILAGPGNNGGDGWAVARWLATWEIPVRVVHLGEPAGADARTMREIARRMRIPEEPWAGALPDADLWVDALFGTGLARPLAGDAAAAVTALAGRRVVAVDLPSGLHADTGMVLGAAPRCEATATFARWKPGLLAGQGPELAGDVRVIDLGLELGGTGHVAELADPAELAAKVPSRAVTSHKRTSGHLLVIAGSPEMAGAAILCCEGALAAGVGLLTLSIPRDAIPRLGRLPPEVMVLPRDGGLPDPARYSAIAAGPGLGGGRPLDPALAGALAAGWREWACPAIFDADALPCADGPRPDRVVTPHPGEASRILGWDATTDRLRAVRELPGVALLKGPNTLISDGLRIHVNRTGNPGLATGGTGDVLAGVIGGLLARGVPAWDAARVGAWAHGAAADDLRAAGEDEPRASALPAAIARFLASHRADR